MDKADKIIQKAELKARKAAQQVELANKKAEAAKQKRAARAQKKAQKITAAATKKAAAENKRAAVAAKKAQLATQKAEQRREKALAKAAAKAGGALDDLEEASEAGAAPKKKGSKKKLLLIAIPVVALAVGSGVFFFLRGRGGGEEEAPPEPISIPTEYMYTEEGEPVIALPVWGEEVQVYCEEIAPGSKNAKDAATLSDKEGEDGEEEEADEDGFTKILYRYEGLQSPVDLIAAYATLMTTQDAGFSMVDDTLMRIDLPEEFAASGSIQLARNGTGGGVQSLLLSWEETGCSVTLDMPEGKVHDPKPESSGAAGAPARKGLSDLEAMHPSQLGLPGNSMDEYELMPQEGSVRIAGSVCARVNIYGKSSGQIAGSYFLSNDGKLYKLDEDANAVVELAWE